MIQYQFTASRLDNGESITGNLCQLADGTFIMPQDCFGSFRQPPFHSEWMMESMGERGATGQYEAMRYGWEYCVQRFREFVPKLIAIDPDTIRRVIDIDDTEIKTTEELQAESTQLRNEGNYILGKQKILADIISQRLRDAAVATRPWKVGDIVEVLTWQGRKKEWVEGICSESMTPGGFNHIAVKTKSGAAHKTNTLRPYSSSGSAQYRFEGKCYTFDIHTKHNQSYSYKEVQP